MGLKNKKKIIIVVIITLIVSISTVSYALWTTTHIQTGQNSITTGCLDIKFTEGDSINIINGYPITDEAGKKSKGTTFSITNTCTIPVAYEVVLDEITTTLADSNLKINVSGSREIEPVLLSEMSETDPVPLTGQEVSSAKSILKDVVPGAEASGQTGGKKTYVLRLWITQDITESLGRGKEFKGRIAIRANQINKTDKNLINNIIANNPIQTETPDFSKGCPNSSESCTSGLYKAEDDQGESYYFRGDRNELNNNVEFAEKEWKILRINGDGTIRLILADNNWNINSIGKYNYNNYEPNNTHAGKYTGYTYDNTNSCTKNNPCEVTYNNGEFSNEKFGGTNSDIKITLETWYKDKLNNYDDKIATSYFCNDTSYGVGDENAIPVEQALFYGSYKRIMIDYAPSLKCPNPTKQDGSLRDYGGVYKTKIGILNVDEMNTGGLSPSIENGTKSNYLYKSGVWWSMSPYVANSWAGMFQATSNRLAYYNNTYNENEVIPVINLKADVQVTGVGTSFNPYVIK